MTRDERMKQIAEATAEARRISLEQEALVESNKGKPMRVGFMFSDDEVIAALCRGEEQTEKPSHWVVASVHPDSQTDFFCVPLWDRPALEFDLPDLWENDEEVCIPFPARGWGEPVLNYNQACWMNLEELNNLRLCAVWPETEVEANRKEWLRRMKLHIKGDNHDL